MTVIKNFTFALYVNASYTHLFCGKARGIKGYSRRQEKRRIEE